MNALAALANGAWFAASLPEWQRFRRALAQPAQAQKTVLRRLLTENADSAYGRAHGFGAIRDYERFRARVPVVDYDAIEPWITRIRRGDAAVLTREPVTRLLPTSGSSGGRKLIPFTASLQRELGRAIAPWLVDLCRAHPSMGLGTAYWSVSPAIAGSEEPSTVPVGFDDDSAYLGGIRRRLAESTFAAPSALRLARDMESFRYLTLLCLLRQPDWSFASVWHPSFLTLLLDALPDRWDELLQDVERGGCQRVHAEPADIRRAMQGRPQPRRARALRRVNPGDPHAVWPRLRLVSCWGDGQAAFALAGLRARLPRASVQTKGLLATEAFVSIPYRRLHPVAVTSHFFEFDDGNGGLWLAHELKPGQTYAVIVTTGGGLWRYRLGDLVEVDGFIGATPSLRFIGRGSGISDLCGEKLAEGFVTLAVRNACEACGFTPPFALLAPEVGEGDAPRYALFAEGRPPAGFPGRLDEELRANPHYALCRDLGQLGVPVCFETGGGAYEIFCRVGVSEGRRLGEIKPQSLSVRTDWRHHFQSAHQREEKAGKPWPLSR